MVPLPIPFKPSDLEWWQWGLYALGAAILAGILLVVAAAFAEKQTKTNLGVVFVYIALIPGLSAVAFLVLAITRFLKWAWAR